MASSRIGELASIIQESTAKLEKHFVSHGLPLPSFDASNPLTLPFQPEVASHRTAVLEATDELHSLIKGPIESVTDRAVSNRSCSKDVTAYA